MQSTHVCCLQDAGVFSCRAKDPDALMTQLSLNEPIRVLKVVSGWSRILAAHYTQRQGWVNCSILRRTEGSIERWLGEQTTSPESEPIEVAMSYLGAPYLWGGMSVNGIDCSGLVHMAYRRTGLLIPRDSFDQESEGLRVSWSKLMPGDLITYGEAGDPSSGRPVHVAFWVGRGKILHAHGAYGVKRVILGDESPGLFARRRHGLAFVRS
jgi:hypothetical protein